MTVLQVANDYSAKTYKMLGKDRPVQFFDIMLHQIQEILMDHFGFRLLLSNSGQVFSFIHLDIDKKAHLIQTIKDNASRYMQVTIQTTVTENSSISVVDSSDLRVPRLVRETGIVFSCLLTRLR